jgi:antitoxin component YwqK of YwqJK toxin-antitoxin module
MTESIIETKAFKGTHHDLKGFDNFQFSVGGIYQINRKKYIKPYEYGFHACINLVDCFEHYNNDGSNRFFEVTIFGEYKLEGPKIRCRKIRIDKEIMLNEVLNGEFIDYYKNKKFYVNGKLHRDDNLPAIICPDGTQKYYINGKLHRDGNLPAIIHPDGSKEYYLNEKHHRDGDLPAVIDSDGYKQYFVNGQLHRDGDLPAVIYPSGTQMYYKNDELHREGDLPARITSDGTTEYYKNGKLHRDCGLPAVFRYDGTKEYFVNGKKYVP